MKIAECARESETLQLVLSRRLDVGEDLQVHLESCEVCREIAAVATALRKDREESMRDVRVPAAGQIWWRAALRAHVEAQDAARRPLIWLQGIGGACAVAIVAALVTLVWPSISDATAALAGFRPDVAPLIEVVRPVIPVAVAVLVCLVLTPLAVYFALSDE
jgi:hypothetical protein